VKANRSGKSGARSGGDTVIDYAGKSTAGHSRRGPRLPAGAPVAVALAIAFAGSGASAGLLAYRLCTDGVIAVLWLIAATGIGWGLLRRMAMPRLLRFATAAALGLGVMSLVLLGLGLLGWLNAVTAWGILGAGWGLGVFWLVVHRRGVSPSEVASSPQTTRWRALWWLAMPSLGLAILGAVVPPGLLWQDEPAGYDVTEYHLQVPREWYESGRIVPLHHNVFSYMPMNVEVHDLLAMHLRGGPWAGMYLAQFMHAGWMALAVFAAAAVASALSDAPWAGPLAGVTMAVVPWVTLLAPIAYNEAGLMLFGGLAIGWAMLARDWRGWLIAGAMAGLACGVKLTAGPMVVIAVVIAAIAVRLWRSKGTPTELVPWIAPPFKGLAIFVAASAVTFSPWLIRNQVWAHNPVFPERMETLGRAHFSEVQVERWRKAHSPTEAERPALRRIEAAFTRIAADWRYGFVFLPLGVAAMVMRRDRAAAFLGLLLVVQLIVWLAFTHLQGRFYILAIPIAAIAIGLVRRPTWPVVAASLAGVVVIIGLVVQVPRYASLVWPLAHNGALGVEDLRWLVEIRSGINLDSLPTEGPIVLVGDAEAFTYSGIPMTRLRYRTVFDVPPAPNGDWLKAWTGDEKGTVIVSPNDLRRFKKTYFEVPTPPQEELDRRPGAYLLKR
jgi:hypothetical protein